ncbi:putative sugar transferase EpsL [Sporomusa rhizae]|uniref:sugar transferase n=1 Tax=Sporomusa rhizae TaxID=357999 RepID=UPI00352A9A25
MKRFIDIISSLIALILLLPLFTIISTCIKLESKGPIFFSQRRVGINDREFTMYKFRSMLVGTPEVATDKLTNSQMYITRIGHVLRKYSLDELPQLINIINGDMSIIGPRPALFNQYDLRELRNKHRISRVRPGLSGWAQVNGRDEISLEEKVKLDLYYVEHQSTLLDLRIIILTLLSIISGDGNKVRNAGKSVSL